MRVLNKAFVVFLLCITFHWGNGQNKYIDSLKESVASAGEDTLKVNLLNKLSKKYWEIDPQQAVYYGAQQALLAQKLAYLKGLGDGLNNIAYAKGYQGKYNEALTMHQEALLIRKKINDRRGIAGSYNNIGVIYYYQSNNKKAIEYYKKASDILREIGELKLYSAVLNNIAELYVKTKEYAPALDYHLRSLKIKEDLKDTFGIAVSYSNIGSVYHNMGQNASAIDSYQKSLELKKRIADRLGEANCYNNIGNAMSDMGKQQEAVSWFSKAESLYRDLGNKEKLANCFICAGENYSKMDNKKLALKYYEDAKKIQEEIDDKDGLALCLNNIGTLYFDIGDNEKAKMYLLKSVALSKESGNNAWLRNAYGALHDLYVKQKDYKNAYEYLFLYKDISDAQLKEKSSEQMAEMLVMFDSEKKDKEIIKKEAEIKIQQADAKQKSLQRNGFIIGFSLMIVLAVFIFRSYRQKQKANVIITRQKEEVEKQRNLIEEQKVIVEHQKELVEEKNKEVMDSIYYARRIQRAVITSDTYISKYLHDYFVFYNPKDIVSGDFYWALEHGGKFYITAADCTGHGVPGAFMSLLNISILNEVLIEKKIKGPHLILNEARKDIIKALNPNGTEETKDGMDCILCSFDLKDNILEYAAANNAFYIIRNKELIICRADKMPVGKSPRDHEPFTLYTIPLQKGDIVYLLTDGLPDQFGGPKGKKFKYKQLEEILLENAHLPMLEQRNILEKRFNDWKGSLEQVDDVLLIGIRV